MPELATLGLDPYAAWLEVETSRRPANPYELLKLEPLEHRRARIEAAAIRQRRALDSFRTSADPTVWSKLEEDLENAVTTLLDPERKSILDASIRRQLVVHANENDSQSAGSSGMVAKESGIVLRCLRCETANLPDRKFCASCGGPLWEPCPQCNVVGPSGERFCGSCGCDIQELLRQKRNALTEKLDAAASLQAEHRFDEAHALLRDVAKVEDGRLDELASRASERMERYTAERRQREGQAALAYENFQRLVEAYRWEDAIASLKNVSPRLRSREMEAAMEDAQTRLTELNALIAEIKAAVAAKKTIEILPRIDRVLALNPKHESIRQLGRDIAVRLEKGSLKLLHEHRYQEACRLLRQIPSYALTDNTKKMLSHATELSWMWDDLRTSPIVSTTVLGLADRLLKVAPGNTEAAKLRDDLLREKSKVHSTPWLAGPMRPGVSSVGSNGFAIQSWVGVRRLQFASDEVHQQFQQAPGRFFVACGLALQGLGQAAVNISLLPEKKSSLLGGLKARFQKKPERTAWGLDLGGSSIKAVKLAWDANKGEVRIEACSLLEPRGTITGTDLGRDSAIADGLLREFLAAQKPAATDSFVVNLPNLSLLGRFVTTPPVEPKKLDSLVEFEARQQIPYKLEELVWDYATVDGLGTSSREAVARRVLILAAKEPMVRNYLMMFEHHGMKVQALQSDAIALHNLHQFEIASTQSTANPTDQPLAVLLDVGAQTTNIVASGPSQLWFRTIGTGADNFNVSLVRDLQLSHEQAEQWKRDPVKARRLSEMYATLQPVFSQLSGEIQRSLAASQINLSQGKPIAMIGCGGGFQIHGLFRHLLNLEPA